MKVVVIGSSNTDMIIQVPRIPRPGETILGGRFSSAAGGKGANQAVAAARAGGDVTFIACLGRDSIGAQSITGFEKDGIDVRFISRDAESPSGVALIFVGENGENSIAVAGGANMSLTPEKIMRNRDVIQSADILVMQLESPLESVEAAASLAYEKQVPVILNPAPAQPLSDKLLKKITVLTPNESEAELLTGVVVTGIESAREAAARLRERGVEKVIITMGAKGAFVSLAGREAMVPGFQVEPVDTTAAGDVFNGALSVALAEGHSLEEAVRFANAAAALSVTKLGAQPSAPKRSEIEAFLHQS
ncbi:MAG: ribokinase [Acidobacteriota bacterium]